MVVISHWGPFIRLYCASKAWLTLILTAVLLCYWRQTRWLRLIAQTRWCVDPSEECLAFLAKSLPQLTPWLAVIKHFFFGSAHHYVQGLSHSHVIFFYHVVLPFGHGVGCDIMCWFWWWLWLQLCGPCALSLIKEASASEHVLLLVDCRMLSLLLIILQNLPWFDGWMLSLFFIAHFIVICRSWFDHLMMSLFLIDHFTVICRSLFDHLMLSLFLIDYFTTFCRSCQCHFIIIGIDL